MRKIFTLFVVSFFTLIASAQGHHAAAAMKFVGKANFSVSGVNVPVESDTILYAGSDFTIPSMTYNMSGHDMTIPSFVITNTTFTGGYAGVTWEDQTFTATTADSTTVNGSSLVGSFTHNSGIYNVKLTITFTYGKMPMPITYTIDGYYVKAYSTPDQLHEFMKSVLENWDEERVHNSDIKKIISWYNLLINAGITDFSIKEEEEEANNEETPEEEKKD